VCGVIEKRRDSCYEILRRAGVCYKVNEAHAFVIATLQGLTTC